jgi:hypothetical protein
MLYPKYELGYYGVSQCVPVHPRASESCIVCQKKVWEHKVTLGRPQGQSDFHNEHGISHAYKQVMVMALEHSRGEIPIR